MNPLAAWFANHPDVRRWQLAEFAGVDKVTVSYWRLGTRYPTIAHRQQIERFTKFYTGEPVTLASWSDYQPGGRRAA